MILTNTLLSIGFSLIANFTNVVAIPADQVPTRIEDLKGCDIGSPLWPADLGLLHRRGSFFRIAHGVVQFYVSPGSFMNLDDPKLIPQFRGTSSLSSNQVLALAEKTIRRLVRRGDPITGLRPHVRHLQESSSGPEVPFYEISWPNPEPDGVSPAWVEIDARRGQIVRLILTDHAFYDLAFAWEMRKRVYTPDPEVPTQIVPERCLPCPSTNQALKAINSWLWLCQGLGVSPGNNTNLAAVDWGKTCIFTNPWIAATAVVCRVAFTNGNRLDSVGGITCNSFFADACYANDWNVRSPEEWFLFEGKINHRWENLVRNLERVLLEKLRLPKELLAAYSPQLRNTGSSQLGGTGLKRVLVHWTNGLPQKVEYRNGAAWAWENHLGFSAEFDVESGELKSIRFRDPNIIEALGRAQSKSK